MGRDCSRGGCTGDDVVTGTHRCRGRHPSAKPYPTPHQVLVQPDEALFLTSRRGPGKARVPLTAGSHRAPGSSDHRAQRCPLGVGRHVLREWTHPSVFLGRQRLCFHCGSIKVLRSERCGSGSLPRAALSRWILFTLALWKDCFTELVSSSRTETWSPGVG